MAVRKLVSMKLTPSEKKESKGETIASTGPEFPFGLSMHLNDDVLAKLGIKELPEVGDVAEIEARVVVDSVNMNAREPGKKNQSISIQITDMALAKARKKPDEEIMFGKMEG